MIPAFGEIDPVVRAPWSAAPAGQPSPRSESVSPRPRPANRAPARLAIPELRDAAAAAAVLKCALPRAHAPQAGMCLSGKARAGLAMALDPTPPTAHVSAPSGRVVGIPEGSRLVFGRGPDADLVIPAGRGLSRRAGVITAVAGGAWVANISYTHALYAEGDGYRIRLPRLDGPGEPAGRVVHPAGHRAGRLPRDAGRGPAVAAGRRPARTAALRRGRDRPARGRRLCCRSTWTRTPSSSSWP